MATVNPIINELSYEMAEAFEEINKQAIQEMATHARDIGRLTPKDLHRLEQMDRMNVNIKNINKEIAKQAQMTASEMQAVYQVSGILEYKSAMPFYKASGKRQVPFAKNKAMQQYIGSINKLTENTFQNLSRTTAISKNYKKLVDRAIYGVTSGVEDYNSFIKKTIEEVCGQGIRVEYASGYKRRLDSAVRMNILDGARAVNNGVRMIAGTEFEADGVEIDAHGLCAPDHIDVQGRQFSNEQFEELQTKLERPISEMNCQHSYTPIILGVSEPALTEEELQDLKDYSNELLEIDGKQMTRYQASQAMRNIETEIRRAKEIEIAGRSAEIQEITEGAIKKQARLEARYRRIANEAGLTPRPARYDISDSANYKKAIEKHYKGQLRNLYVESASEIQYAERGVRTINNIAEGKDLTGVWSRRKEFDFAIEDLINAQCFDGVPKILEKPDFDKAVKKSNFVAQRTYGADSMEMLEEYRDTLYNGKWYVDCSEGGAQYGQGMYCAGDYTGKITAGMEEEMEHYRGLCKARHGNGPTFTETFTLDPSAKVIDYFEISGMKGDEVVTMLKNIRDKIGHAMVEETGFKGAERDYLLWGLNISESIEPMSLKRAEEFKKTVSIAEREKYDKLRDKIENAIREGQNSKQIEDIRKLDVGSYAVLKGYDVINATGHGLSGSYTVILNRTKLIILKP